MTNLFNLSAMTVQCSNQACNNVYNLDMSKLTPGSWQAMTCKCGQATNFQVPARARNSPAATAVNPPASGSAKAKPVRQASQTLVLDEPAGNGASEQIGWLVVHDEHTPAQTLSLTEGRNVIGRKSPDKPCHLMIDTTDQHMSRNHAVLEVSRRLDGHFQYLLSDSGSTNGTFINGSEHHRLSPYDQIFLKDGDTIQLGRTKVVLKTGQTVSSPGQAHEVVSRKDYLKTVVL